MKQTQGILTITGTLSRLRSFHNYQTWHGFLTLNTNLHTLYHGLLLHVGCRIELDDTLTKTIDRPSGKYSDIASDGLSELSADTSAHAMRNKRHV